MFIVGYPDFDWCTVTTFSPLLDKLRGGIFKQDMWGEFSIGRYTGHVARRGEGHGSIFLGEGVQKGKPHFLIQGTGLATAMLTPHLLDMAKVNLLHCTRLDIQCTVPKSANSKFTGKWLWSKFPEGASIIGKGTELSLYPTGFGSTSDTSWRIYVKTGDKGEEYLRWEVMLRGKKAKAVFKELASGAGVVPIYSALFYTLITRFDALQKIKEVGQVLDIFGDSIPMRVFVEPPKGDTKEWILSTCLPSIRKYMNSDDNSDLDKQEIFRALAKVYREKGDYFSPIHVQMVDNNGQNLYNEWR